MAEIPTDFVTADPRHCIPPIHGILNHDRIRVLTKRDGHGLVRARIDASVQSLRARIADGEFRHECADASALRASLTDAIILDVESASRTFAASCPARCINATGILLHTGLGRAPLSQRAIDALVAAAAATPIEVDPQTGVRASRAQSVRDRLKAITQAEDALVVNNNAAATLLVLQSLCQKTEVLISRGELVEIGGSFRLPDIFRLAGVTLVEVGTTNRTRLDDYTDAITPQTSAILRVHPSNFRMLGFVESPPLSAMVDLARRSEILLIDDIGSGLLQPADCSRLQDEPNFADSLGADADIVLASADKLLGGPQAGLILGRSRLIARIGRHPLARAVRPGKLTLAALAATLDEYLLRPESPEIPLHRMMSATIDQLRERAERLSARISRESGTHCRLIETKAETGGGSLPAVAMDSIAVSPDVARPDKFTECLRLADHPVWARIHENRVLLDLRSVSPADDDTLAATVIAILRST